MIRAWVVVLAVLGAACGDLGDPGGGGDSGGTFTFTGGAVFVRGGEIWIANESDGGYADPVQLTTSGSNRHPSLSPDGTQVAFVHAGSGANGCGTVATDASGAPRSVYVADATQANFRTPVFSPDGSFVVFAFDKGTLSALGRVDAAGSGFQQLTLSSVSYASPSFFPDGSAVLAISGSSSSVFTQLERVNVTTGVTSSVLGALDPAVQAIANRAVLSDDGTQAVFDGRLSSSPSTVRIFVVGLTGANAGLTHQATDYPANPSANDSFPCWTDATHLGFSSTVGGADQVYVLPASSVETSGGLTIASAQQPWFGP